MRVIAGKHRGRVLCEFKGDAVRPTSDRAREALFNILQCEIRGAEFLDLFCGSGAVGIEAISRGAKGVTFVDKSAESIKITKKNLDAVGETARIITSDAIDFADRTDEKFDIIFLDPPYKFDVTEILVKLPRLLAADGVIVYEHGDDKKISNEELELQKSRRYGIAIFDFFKVKK